MELKTESVSKIWETEDICTRAPGTAINTSNMKNSCLKPNELCTLNDSNVAEPCNQISRISFSKLEAECAPISHSNILETHLVSDVDAYIDSKDPLANIKEEIATNFHLDSPCSAIILPTCPTAPASYGMSIKSVNPVVILERLPPSTTSCEMISANTSSIGTLEDAKNRSSEEHVQFVRVTRYVNYSVI